MFGGVSLYGRFSWEQPMSDSPVTQPSTPEVEENIAVIQDALGFIFYGGTRRIQRFAYDGIGGDHRQIWLPSGLIT